jgi:protein phosphatase
VVSDPARLGLISGRETAEAEMRHVLTRSLGNGMFVGADTSEHIVLGGDVLLLCSDGLHGALSTAEIAKIVSANADLGAAARQLIEAANERDGGDNVSVQLIRVRSVERIGMYRGRPYKLA